MTSEVKNLSRLTNPYFDDGAGMDSRERGMRDMRFVSGSPQAGFVLSPASVSYGHVEAVLAQDPWHSPQMMTDGFVGGYSGVTAAPSGEGFWPSGSPTLERTPSIGLSYETEEPKKRHRRVYGPVKGNNTFGKRGKLSCTQCRKIRSKCVYNSPDEPCEFCVKRGHECIKTWGPKKTLSATKSPSTEVIQINNTPTSSSSSSPEAMPLVASTMSLLFDTNLPDSEMDLIRYLHSHHRGARTSSCVGVLLQNLWESYGNIPTDKTLLYASLMWESYWKGYDPSLDYKSSPEGIVGGWSPGGTWEFFNYKAKFIKELQNAIQSPQNLTECHFFALFLASQSTKSGVRGFQDELHTYQQGMVRILKILLSQPMDEQGREKYRPLMKLYKFIVSFTRRVMCRGDFSMPEYLVEDAAKLIPDDTDDTQTALIPVPHTQTSVVQTITAIPETRVVKPLHEEGFEHDWDRWNETVCCLCNEFATMADCFQIFVLSGETSRITQNAIRSVRRKVDGLVSIHNISYVFRTMNDSFVPLNVRQGHPHERGLINFLISLFRCSSLLIVLEYLLDGEVERHRRRVFEEFKRAEELVKEYDPLVWSLRKTELVSSLGLILAPFMYDDQDELDDRREWLTEIWRQHHKEETERFGRCAYCECRSLARMQRLWRTDMTRRDYISFLGENSWIWCTEPGWSMEPLLKERPDSYETGMDVTCVRCAQ